jgi:hypothetical protein
MTRLQSLSKKCTQQTGKGAITALQLVRGYNDSFAVNTEGGITAFSLTDATLTSLTLGTDDQALEYLYLSGCTALETIVFEPNCTFPNLTHLYLDGCNLTDIKIPAGCTALQQIYVQKQKKKLKSLVFEGDCPALVLLDASDNDLLTFNMPVIFENLKYLYLKGNENIGYLPKEIYIEKTNSADSVKAYLRATLQSGSIINREAKCIFFGNGRAGKTTLSHQLRKGVFDKDIELTHGILIEEWTIYENEFPTELKEKIDRENQIINSHSAKIILPPDSIQLNVWDFGGQEYFHATHRLFLNDKVLYLVVWEEDTNTQNEKTGDYPKSYWQSNIRHYAPKNITINIHNKEKGNAVIKHSELQYKITERVETDAHSIEAYELDVKTLKTGIFKQLPHLEYLGAPIPKLYNDIRQELRRLKTDEPCLSFEEYRNICQQLDETRDKLMQEETNIEILTTFLHNTGSLICYRYDSKKKDNSLDNYVFINPQWVTKTIYQILDEETLKGKGEFNKTHVVNILKTYNNVIINATDWIRLMMQFELIFKKNDTNDFIAPQYLPLKCPDLSDKAWGNLVANLPYQLVLWYPNFLPKSIISRFICLNGNLAKDYYWKYGIVIDRDNEQALVRCNYDMGQIIIQTRTHLSQLAVKLFDILRGIDATDSLEVALLNSNNVEQMVGFVNFKALKERADKTDVEWNRQYFEVAPFEALLDNAHGFAFGERLAGRIDGKKKYLHGNSQPLPVEMVENARVFKPFDTLTDPIKILFLAATPMNQKPVNTGLESRFKDLIRQYDDDNRFKVIQEHGVSPEKFHNAIISEKPPIVHFGGHGEEESLVLQGKNLQGNVLTDILELSENTQCVVLNACNTLAMAQSIARHIPYVIGTQGAIDDKTAIAFAEGFYMGIITNMTIENAFKNGLATIKREGCLDAAVLILVKGVH